MPHEVRGPYNKARSLNMHVSECMDAIGGGALGRNKKTLGGKNREHKKAKTMMLADTKMTYCANT